VGAAGRSHASAAATAAVVTGADVSGEGSDAAALAAPREVLVSATARDLVSGSGIVFKDRDEHELKGVGARRIYAFAEV